MLLLYGLRLELVQLMVLVSLILWVDDVALHVNVLADGVVALHLRWVVERLASASKLLAVVERDELLVVTIEPWVFE
jgi:hypothetical protein